MSAGEVSPLLPYHRAMTSLALWRRRLAVLGMVLLLTGLALTVYMGVFEYRSSWGEPVWDVLYPVFDLLNLGAPCIVVLGLAALVVRWRLPHIAARAGGRRARSITILVVILLLCGAVVVGVLNQLLFWIPAIVGCNIHGC
jgi:hypothetical protein